MAKREKLNREGLTQGEWLRAVGQVPMQDLTKLRKAWEDGEDPAEWRAHYAAAEPAAVAASKARRGIGS